MKKKIALLRKKLHGMANTPHDCVWHYEESNLEHSVQCMILCHEARLDPLLGLLHDIGKAATISHRLDGKKRERISFFNHGEVGAQWLDDEHIKEVLNIDQNFIEDVRWHLTPYLPGSKCKDKRTYIRDVFRGIDRKAGSPPEGDCKVLLDKLMASSYDDIIAWCYQNRYPYLTNKDVLYFDSYAIDNLTNERE
jgi:putative nucleotidyltransferase with HDIG domain